MSDEQGCGEGCRTYVDETVGKIIVSIILITFLIALVYGIIIYTGSLNQEHILSPNSSGTEIVDTSYKSVLNTNISEKSELITQKKPVRITSLNTTDEYIQLKNYGSEPVNLAGWKMSDKNGEHIFTFPETTLKPQQTITIYSGSDAENKKDLKGIIIWTTDDVWDDTGDQAVLYDNSGREIDDES